MATTESASSILAIDGCPLDCAKKTLEEAGYDRFTHLRVTDLGMQKGQSPVTDERIEAIAAQGMSALTCE